MLYDFLFKGMTGRCERICHEIPDGEADYFDEIIQNVMTTIEGMMPQLPAGRNGRPQINHGSQQYQQWLKELERSSVRLKSRDQFTLVQHLMVYNTALSIKKSCRVKDALKYVTEFHEKQSENKFKDIDRKLRELYEKVRHKMVRSLGWLHCSICQLIQYVSCVLTKPTFRELSPGGVNPIFALS